MSKHMSGKICLVTGATNGIGEATAQQLAAMGATVMVHGRDAQKGQRVVEAIVRNTGNNDVRFVKADLASLSEVRALAAEVNAAVPRLDVLVNNAAWVGSERKVTIDGYERTFAVDHLAPFLLTNLLLDKIKAAAPSRIVNVSSYGHHFAKLDLDDLMLAKKYSMMHAYGNAKLGNVLFTRSLAKRLAGTGVTVNAVHPGGVNTGLGRESSATLAMRVMTTLMTLFAKTPQQGARTSLYLATSTDMEGKSGAYYANCKPARISVQAQDDALAERLWKESAKLVGLAA